MVEFVNAVADAIDSLYAWCYLLAGWNLVLTGAVLGLWLWGTKQGGKT